MWTSLVEDFRVKTSVLPENVKVLRESAPGCGVRCTDHYFIEPKGIMFFWDKNWDNATIISGRYHKATVDELIEYFKGKEE